MVSTLKLVSPEMGNALSSRTIGGEGDFKQGEVKKSVSRIDFFLSV